MKKILFTLCLALFGTVAMAQTDSSSIISVSYVKLPFSTKMTLVVDLGKGTGNKKAVDEIPGMPETVKSYTEMLTVFMKRGYEFIGTYPGNIVNGPYGLQVNKDETVTLFRKK
jgi:hypothetical protein